MPSRNVELTRFGGNGTGYTFEVFGTVDDPVDILVDYAAIPLNTFFKHINKLPETDVLLFKNIEGTIIDAYNPDFFPDIWASTQFLS